MSLQQVFGENQPKFRGRELTLANLDSHISDTLDEVVQEHTSAHQDEAPSGRIGPQRVVFQEGTLVKREDMLEVYSNSNFGSMRANACVYKGKWMYEVTLSSDGIMQLGWCTLACSFTNNEGVGDTEHSYAYDGKRMRKWNRGRQQGYGQAWAISDVISCCIDCDQGTLSFYRNGRGLGVAYNKVRLGSSFAYFPCVSLSLGENVYANFGAVPLRYPVDGYKPIQEAPTIDVARASLLCKYLSQLVSVTTTKRSTETESNSQESGDKQISDINTKFEQCSLGAGSGDTKYQTVSMSQKSKSHSISNHATWTLAANKIFHHLAPLFKIHYIVDECLVKLLLELVDGAHWNTCHTRVQALLTWMWALMQDHEIKPCLDNLICSLLIGYKFARVEIGYPRQKELLVVLLSLAQHARTRKHMLKEVHSSSTFAGGVRFWRFFHIKSPRDDHFANFLPAVWWKQRKYENDEECQKDKESFNIHCDKLDRTIAEVECIQTVILQLFLTNTDGSPGGASSRFVFLSKMREYAREMVVTRVNFPHMLHLFPLAVTLCLFQRLLSLLRREMDGREGGGGEEREGGGGEEEACAAASAASQGEIFVPLRTFLGDTVNYHDVTRAGGLLSHLRKEHRQTLHDLQLGEYGVHKAIPKHRVLMEHEAAVLAAQARHIGPQLGHGEDTVTYLELLDSLIWLYVGAGSCQFARLASMKEDMQLYQGQMTVLDNKLAACPADLPLVREELMASQRVFTQNLVKRMRLKTWFERAILSQHKRCELWWLLRVVLRTVEQASEQGALLAFLPEYYLMAAVLCHSAVKNLFDCHEPMSALPEYWRTLERMALFYTNHFMDARIVNDDVKFSLIRAFTSFISKDSLRALEGLHELNRLAFVKKLLEPSKDGLWFHTNKILVRFWADNGFGISERLKAKVKSGEEVECLRSAVLQEHVTRYLHHSSEHAVKYIDSLLTQLNSVFSKFIGIFTELQSIADQGGRVLIDERQLQFCSECFEIAVTLTRVLEMMTGLVPQVFLDFTRPSADLLLSRLCQSICQILTRVTSRSGCFDKVVKLQLRGLELVSHFAIVTACAGVLVNLCVHADQQGERAVSAFLSDSNFQPDFLDFMMRDGSETEAEGATAAIRDAHKRPGRSSQHGRTYKEVIGGEDLKTVAALITCFKARYEQTSAPELDEDSVCAICYAKPSSVTFRPCGHVSCRACIAHHMMHSPHCFFCKAGIERLEELKEGTPV